MKFSVVPDPSERRATTMSTAGSLAPWLSVAIAGSAQLVIRRSKIFAIVEADRRSDETLARL